MKVSNKLVKVNGILTNETKQIFLFTGLRCIDDFHNLANNSRKEIKDALKEYENTIKNKVKLTIFHI